MKNKTLRKTSHIQHAKTINTIQIRMQMRVMMLIRNHLEPFRKLKAFGTIWKHLESFRTIWNHLEPL